MQRSGKFIASRGPWRVVVQAAASSNQLTAATTGQRSHAVLVCRAERSESWVSLFLRRMLIEFGRLSKRKTAVCFDRTTAARLGRRQMSNATCGNVRGITLEFKLTQKTQTRPPL